MGVVHYLAEGPRCWGDCARESECASPDLCAGAAAAMADASAQCRRQLRAEPELMGARMGMACAETTTSPGELGTLPHYEYRALAWPWLEHSRPGKLTEAELDRHIAERAERRPLPHLLLAKGAMTAHPAPTWLERLRTAWLSFRIRRLGRL